MSAYSDAKPAFCKSCNALLGYNATDDVGPVWIPVMIGTLSVAGVGRYCSHECRDLDPDYYNTLPTMDAERTEASCACGHPQVDHLNGEANCIGNLGHCGCQSFRRAA